MASIKPHYFNNYHFLIKLLALLILCLLPVACNKKETETGLTVQAKVQTAENAVNINTAPAPELEKLPNVGAKLAQKIIEHREKYGNFRKPEHLMMVPGISDRHFRELQSLVKVND